MHKDNRFNLFSEREPRVGVIVGTGPGLTEEAIKQIKSSGLRLFGCNNAWKALDLDVFLACNYQYFDHYWTRGLSDIRADKWTWNAETAQKYGINHIKGRWQDGLSTDPEYIAYHHGAGPQIVNIAYHYGVKKMLLVGWDMRFPGKISNNEYEGSRHFFGEDPLTAKHWPQTGPRGELDGLIKEMETINPKDYGIEIINCTPDSAMTCFPSMSFNAAAS